MLTLEQIVPKFPGRQQGSVNWEGVISFVDVITVHSHTQDSSWLAHNQMKKMHTFWQSVRANKLEQFCYVSDTDPCHSLFRIISINLERTSIGPSIDLTLLSSMPLNLMSCDFFSMRLSSLTVAFYLSKQFVISSIVPQS